MISGNAQEKDINNFAQAKDWANNIIDQKVLRINLWNILWAWNYLSPSHRKLRELNIVYDHLWRSSLGEWFHPNGDLKENYKHHHVKFGIAFVNFAQHCPTLDVYHLLMDEICKVLKKEMAMWQTLYAIYIEPLMGQLCVQETCCENAVTKHM